MRRHFLKETDLAECVITWLDGLRWEVFQEVQPYQHGQTADIVARQAPLLWIIETKLSMSLSLLEQACGWLNRANYVSIAVPYTSQRSGNIVSAILRHFGIGLLRVSSYGDYEEPVRELIAPRLRRSIDPHLGRILRDEHKTYAKAGNAHSRRLSAFKATCLAVRRVVDAEPGITLKDLLSKIETHYASTATARSCLAKWGQAGDIEGVRVLREGKVIRLYPAEGGETVGQQKEKGQEKGDTGKLRIGHGEI